MSETYLDLTLDDVLVLYDGGEDFTPLINGEMGITEVHPQLDDETIRKRTLESLLRLNKAGLIEMNWFTHDVNHLRKIDDSNMLQLLLLEETWRPTSFL